MGDLTQLLGEMRNGSSEAASAVFTRVYDELHRLAASHMRRERSDHTLQTTALMHEAYLRLVGQRDVDWQSRSQFFGVASQMMRRILVSHARAFLSAKRGGLQRKIALEDTDIALQSQSGELLALDGALIRLSAIDARQSQIVELRFFGGLTVEETAQVLDISARTVKRDWMVAKAWLRSELAQGEWAATAERK
jgi:RNA polymerase sigma factor (TIGR02999 family)